MKLDPLPETVRATISLKGFVLELTGRTFFRANLLTFEEAADIALNAEFNFKADRYNIQWDTSSSVDKAKRMDLSQAGEKAEL